MGRKQNHRGDSNSGKNAVALLPPSNAVASKKLQQLVRECSSSLPVHIWNTTPTHEGLVCASSFYTPLGCLDKKCKRDHSMFPLHEALAPGSTNPLTPNPSSSHKRKAPPPLSIQSHSALTDIDEITSWKAPCSTITHIVAGGVLVYSQELGLQKKAAHNTNTNTPPPPPTTTSTTTTTTTTTTTIPSTFSPLFEMLPESVLIHLFLTFLSPSSFGMVAICSKEMFSVFLGPENVAAILRHYKLGIPPTPFAAFKTLQSHFVHWRNFNALCDAIDYSAVSPKKSGGPEVSWVVRSNTGVSVGLSLSNDRRFVNVYKLDKTGSLSPAKTKIKILPTIKGQECHDMFVNDNVTVVIPSSEDVLRCLIYKTQDLIQGVGYVEGETELFKFPNEFFGEFQNYEMILHPTENLLFTQSLGVLGDGYDYDYEHDDYSLLVSVRVDIQEGLVDVKRLLLTSKHFPKAVDDPEYFVDEYASLFEPGDFQMTFFNNNIVTLTLDPADHESTLLKQKEEGSTKECCLHVNAPNVVTVVTRSQHSIYMGDTTGVTCSALTTHTIE
ncbi:hypothetical protein TL16_g07626 [Triparma laevis f. inornata]|uniref:Uncharacterized protein n=1 Tax=Triparma laevis f. inornata TaxID=1714386 RepID=A0A9W7AZV6_9STRA|nr:hypothetical protein TL16_g07626 [Triparma laevis f. inornata]